MFLGIAVSAGVGLASLLVLNYLTDPQARYCAAGLVADRRPASVER